MSSMPPIAVIAGGLGTRLGAISKSIPKSLVEVAGRPFIAHQLELFARRGIREAVFCVGHLGEQVEAYVQAHNASGIKVEFSYDGARQRGTGGAIRQALPRLGAEFLVTYGDSYLDIDYAEVVDAFRASACTALMTVFRNEGRWDTSNVEFEGGRIQAYDKTNRTPRMHYIDYGLLAMSTPAFREWDSAEQFDLLDLLKPLAAEGRLAGLETSVRFFEVGSHAGIASLEAHLTARRPTI